MVAKMAGTGKSAYYSSKGLVLRNRDYLEADRLVTIFTEKYGKISAIAKGVKKAKSSLRACTQPFCYSEFFLRRGKSLDAVSQGQTLDFFGNIRENMDAVMYLLYITEILDKVLPERQPYPELLACAVKIIKIIDAKGPRPLWLRYFEAQVMKELGFEPVLDQCVHCGNRKDLGNYFSIAEGGVVCSACYPKTPEVIFFMNAEIMAILRLLLRADLVMLERLQIKEKTAQQVEQFWEKYLEYHLERRFALKNALTVLKKMMPENPPTEG